MTQTPASNRIGDLVRSLLDRGYQQATQQTLAAIAASTQSGIVAQRLAELDAEAARLAGLGERLQPDNPVLRALVADLETAMQRNAVRIDVAGTDLQQAGTNAAQILTRELALPGIGDAALAAIGIRWNVPSAEAVNAIAGFANSTTWANELKRYPQFVQQIITNQAIRGFVEGWSPIRASREIRRMAQGVPIAHANNLMRTLYLQSYRTGSVAHQVANADVIVEHIRIATLDSRVCLSCLSLHGTRLAVGERVDDHWSGRCTSVSVVRGVPRQVEDGESWFRRQSEETQRAQMGGANYEAWRAGRVQLSDFVHRENDPIFGAMIRENSLKGILGDAAREFYSQK